jgi:hypothetical protein
MLLAYHLHIKEKVETLKWNPEAHHSLNHFRH